MEQYTKDHKKDKGLEIAKRQCNAFLMTEELWILEEETISFPLEEGCNVWSGNVLRVSR